MFSKFKLRHKIIAGILTLILVSGTASYLLVNIGNVKDLSQNAPEYIKSTEISDKLENSYSVMKKSLSKGDITTVRSIASEMLGNLNDMKLQLEESNLQVRDVLSDIDSEEINRKQSDYEKLLEEKFSKAEDVLDQIANASGDLNENLEVYGALFAEAELSSDKNIIEEFNPENVINADYEEIDVNKAQNIEKALSTPVMTGVKATKDDLSLVGDVALSDEIKAKADELKTPYAVYEFIRNSISYEAYYGSRKGAIGTYDAFAGNDADTASLLIGMLRYLGYNARYANGTVRLTIEQAMALTAADDGKNAVCILANMGRDVKVYSQNGKPLFVDMNQTWVEAYVPYTDYRGTGNAQGEYMWIPLDASFKSYDIKKFDFETNSNDFTAYNESVSKAESLLSQLPEYENISDIMQVDNKAEWSVPVIVPFDDGFLPLSLEYDVISEKTSVKVTDLVPSDTINVEVGYGLSYTARAADVYNKSITLDYSPADQYDRQLLEQYGSISEVPPYLIMLVPTLNIDDEVVASGDAWLEAVSPGAEQKMEITISSSGKSQKEVDDVIAGSVYSIVLNYGLISSNEYETAYEYTRENNFHATTANIYSSEILGSFLTFAGRTYYTMVDVPNRYATYAYNVSQTSALGCTVMSYDLNKETLFGYVRALLPGDFSIDVEFNSHSLVDLCAENNNSKLFGMITGFCDSRSEARVWEILLKADGVSTVDVLAAAAENNIETLYINSNNYDKEISKLSCGDKALTDIKNFVNQGFVIVVPAKEVKINAWEGTGYIAANFNTGSVVYRLSGLTNGGSTTENSDLSVQNPNVAQLTGAELDDYICASMYIVNSLYRMYTVQHYSVMVYNIATFTSSCYGTDVSDMVFGGMGLVNSVCDLCTTIERYYSTLSNFLDYACDDNEEAGRQIVITALDFLADYYEDMDSAQKIVDNIITSTLDELAKELTGIEDLSELIETSRDFAENVCGVELSTPGGNAEREYYMTLAFDHLTNVVLESK